MTTPPPAGPGAPAGSQAPLRLSRLLKRPVTDRGGGSLGRLADVIVRLRGADYPLVTGLVAAVGGREIFVPIDQVSSFDGDPLRLSSARLSLRHFERRDGEVLLRADVLGPPAHRRAERPPGPRRRPGAGAGRPRVDRRRGGHPRRAGMFGLRAAGDRAGCPRTGTTSSG